ncbi:MAG: ABC transporter substrate-binding protein [Vicinamibacterales bacterium]|jgi:iron complex transport system substrate-binding protein|nr:ABC transporter substrate-binding protein [Vicinamibacterales bacterium]
MFQNWLDLRLVTLLMVALVVAFVLACGESEAESSVTIVAAQPTATAKPAPTATVTAVATEKPVATVSTVATAVPVATAGVETFDKSRFANVDGIVDQTNFDWPRSIETTEGVITLDAPPTKIHSLSLGHSEILAALIDFERLTAVYSFFVDEEQSNIAGLSANSKIIGHDPEEVVALDPEVIVASRFTNADTVALMVGAGIPVARTNLENSALGNVPNILLMGYMVGAEVEAIALAEEIEARMKFITDVLASDEKPRVLSVSKWTSAFAAGSGTTEGGIIEQAGGINAAADSGIEGHQQVSIESIAAINPDVIVVPQPLDGANVFIEELVSSPALADIPAVKNGEIHYVPPRYHTTLSHWNVRGIERLATLLFPSHFSGVTFDDFSNWGD